MTVQRVVFQRGKIEGGEEMKYQRKVRKRWDRTTLKRAVIKG
jgi:hypothetical protein